MLIQNVADSSLPDVDELSEELLNMLGTTGETNIEN